MTSTTATAISLTWSVPSGSVVTSYVVAWQRDTSGDCPDEDEGSMSITDGSTSLTLTGLEEDSDYRITVTATNAAGSGAVSHTVSAVTGEAGYYFLPLSTVFQKLYLLFCFLSSSSVCCSHFCEYIQYLLQHHCPVGGSELHPPQWRHNRLLSAVWGTGEWKYTDCECLRRWSYTNRHLWTDRIHYLHH